MELYLVICYYKGRIYNVEAIFESEKLASAYIENEVKSQLTDSDFTFEIDTRKLNEYIQLEGKGYKIVEAE